MTTRIAGIVGTFRDILIYSVIQLLLVYIKMRTTWKMILRAFGRHSTSEDRFIISLAHKTHSDIFSETLIKFNNSFSLLLSILYRRGVIGDRYNIIFSDSYTYI